MPDDTALVAAAQAGDPSAFEELIHRHERRLYSLAYRLMGNPADAADALQEILIRTYLSLSTFQGRSAFSTWLYRVATNICLDRMRRRPRPCASLDQDWEREDSLLHRIPADTGDPWLAAEQSEVRAMVHRALQSLPCDYRTVIVLKDLEGYSYAEIEEYLGCSRTTLKSRLHRARQALRVTLRQTGALPVATGDSTSAWKNTRWKQAL